MPVSGFLPGTQPSCRSSPEWGSARSRQRGACALLIISTLQGPPALAEGWAGVGGRTAGRAVAASLQAGRADHAGILATGT
jgi:hypothetical protein